MAYISDNVRQDLVTLVPSSVVNEISCFVFYDQHPRDKQSIDITICTLRGEIKEFYKREILYSYKISNGSKPVDIRILRNTRCELFYLVALDDEVLIISRSDKLQIVHRIQNVESYEVEDSVCRGQGCLKIIKKDDAVPLIFDDNLENLGERAELLSLITRDETPSMMAHIGTKLTEAKYNVVKNEQFLKEITKMRHSAAHTNYHSFSPNTDGAIFKQIIADSGNVLTIKSKNPWVKMCSKQLVLILEVLNKSSYQLEEISMLLHNSMPTSVYTTKIFESMAKAPFWKESSTNTINTEQAVAVVVVINIKELRNNVGNQINFNGLISYKIGDRNLQLPFDDVKLSSMAIMGEHFDVLSDNENPDKYDVLALITTSEKTDICLRHIQREDESPINLTEVFCEHLLFEKLHSEVVVHKKSPYHILHGVMIVLNGLSENCKWIISIYTRSSSQLLAFINYMYDAVPSRIIATTLNQKIVAKSPELSNYNEDTTACTKHVNYIDFKTSILKQTSTVLEYLDDCMMKMNENKNPSVQNRIGREIDMFAGDVTCYKVFRDKMLQEGLMGIKSTTEVEDNQLDSEGNTFMDIDSS